MPTCVLTKSRHSPVTWALFLFPAGSTESKGTDLPKATRKTRPRDVNPHWPAEPGSSAEVMPFVRRLDASRLLLHAGGSREAKHL